MKTKNKAIKHYKEMIAWAETQEENKKVNYGSMLNEINQDWSAQYCSYCIKYNGCSYCKLSSDYIYTGCCNNLWDKMNNSKTWRTWIKNAKKVLEYIEING